MINQSTGEDGNFHNKTTPYTVRKLLVITGGTGMTIY